MMIVQQYLGGFGATQMMMMGDDDLSAACFAPLARADSKLKGFIFIIGWGRGKSAPEGLWTYDFAAGCLV